MALGKEMIQKGTIGKLISLILTDNTGAPINLTSATVTLTTYEIGDNTVSFTGVCTIDNASNGLVHYTTITGDFDTLGTYYSLTEVIASGTATTVVGPSFEVVENDETLVTVQEFLDFADLAPENAKDQNKIKNYLKKAEGMLNTQIPAMKTTTDVDQIELKKTLICLRTGILYFMNSDENYIDPNKRLPKLEFWRKEYAKLITEFGSQLSATASSPGLSRRVKNSKYSDPNSPDYEGTA